MQIDDLALAGSHLENVRARLVWDVTRVELDSLQARLDRAAITGRLAVNLRGDAAVLQADGKVKGLNWQSGKLDAEGTLETSGTGDAVAGQPDSEGTFTGSGAGFRHAPPVAERCGELHPGVVRRRASGSPA